MLTKRQKFIVSSIVLSLGFIGIRFLGADYRFLGIGILAILSVLSFAWSLDGLGFNATLLVLVLPAFFTLGVGLFWFLLPATVFARIPIIILYGIGMYALSLTMNIFTVSSIRTIALARAAKGVGFVLTLFAGFLLYDAILSLRISWVFTSLIIFAVSFPLFLQGLWSSRLGRQFERGLVLYSAISAYSITGIAMLLYFWPVSVVEGAIFLTVSMYLVLGLGQSDQEGRLFKQTVQEYLVVGIVVFMAMIAITTWR